MKREIRRELLGARDALAPAARDAQAAAVRARLRDLAVVQRSSIILAYVAHRSELDVAPLLSELAGRGKVLGLPRMVGESLEVRQWVPEPRLRKGRFDVREPPEDAPPVAVDQLDLALVPGVGFDRAGNRLGFGRGFYDRFLPTAAQAIRIGISFREQLRERLPATAADARMDWVVTPDEAIRPVFD